MIKEAENTAFIDEINQKESEKVWKARDDALQQRDEARRYLMKLVDEGRQEQLQYRSIQQQKEKEEDLQFLERFQQEHHESIQKEQQQSHYRKQTLKENQQELSKQIQLKKEKEELERQEAYLQLKQQEYQERVHKQRLADQAGSVRVNYPLQKNNWFT
jgi:hypothetical protein